ncbi:MAG: YihY/virulence factor BrkB family protein [Chloroflexia bacterium]|nr:YihY/virulence factor BrkB family protein [Chloroflexia bacterium]
MTSIHELEQEVISHIKRIYRRANRLSGGILDVLKETVRGVEQSRAVEAAASLTFYSIFSLFPLLLVAVVVVSNTLESEMIRRQVLEYMIGAFPISKELVAQNIQRLRDLREPVGLLALISLSWSATSAFSILTRSINRAWSNSQGHPFFKRRLVALGIIGLMAGLLLLSLASTTVLSLLPRWNVPVLGRIDLQDTLLWGLLSRLIPWLFSLLIFLGLYRWVPNIRVKWSAAAWAAFIAATAWQIATSGFTLYLGSRLARYELIYGSLWTIVVLMFWIYISSLITLFGAHLCAAIEHYQA